MKKTQKKLLLLFGIFAVCEIAYQFALYLEKTYYPTTPATVFVLLFVLAVLFVTYIVLARGDAKELYSPDDLDKTIPYSERVDMCDRINRNKAKAKKLLFFIIPLSFVLMLDFFTMFVLEPLLAQLA